MNDKLELAKLAVQQLSARERDELKHFFWEPDTPQIAFIDPKPRVIDRAETASRFNKSLRFVDRLAAQGILKKYRLPGRIRATGFLESDVNRLLQGA